jgi:alkanesulfonate monooxygenase SsuD/methylene tetrahydromethanopterin reductase-like flavin-dependent oxidoreductase (luciferase family)
MGSTGASPAAGRRLWTRSATAAAMTASQSSGRWMEREHEMFGYPLGDVPTRFARFAEGLEVITCLLRQHWPVSYSGQFFTLRDSVLLPRPRRPGGPPILIGGGGRGRTLTLAAQYADIWNGLSITPSGVPQAVRPARRVGRRRRA